MTILEECLILADWCESRDEFRGAGEVLRAHAYGTTLREWIEVARREAFREWVAASDAIRAGELPDSGAQ